MNTETVSEKKCLKILEQLFKDYHPRDFSIRLWDGSVLQPEPGEPNRFALVFKNPGVLRKILWNCSSLSLGEAYIYEEMDIEGDLEGAIKLRDYFTSLDMGLLDKMQFAAHLLSLPSNDPQSRNSGGAHLSGSPVSRERTRNAISFHYDLPVDFWKFWLDDSLQYTCAYFRSLEDDLKTAQQNKLDHICRKLRLRPGDRLLDIGCGWGGLIVHASQHYGVKSMGITLSQIQADYANRIIDEKNLSSLTQVEVVDFRDFKPPVRFDKAVSVGAVEHFGGTLLNDFFRGTWELMKPGGLFLVQGISSNQTHSEGENPSFIQHYVFPDSQLVPIASLLQVAEENGFEVRDLENLREHYVRTLRFWKHNLEKKREKICRITDSTTYRIFHLYLAGFIPFFDNGRYRLNQTLLAKPDGGKTSLPLTRKDWYA